MTTTGSLTEKAREQRIRSHVAREGFTLRKERGRFFVLDGTGRCLTDLAGSTLEQIGRWLAE